MFNAMNRRLMALNGNENLIGHADYMVEKLDELRIREGYDDNAEGRRAAVAHTLRNKTVPLLIDLFRGDHVLVRFVAGADLFDEDALDDLSEALESLGRIDANPIISSAAWWNPKHPTWDHSRFAARFPATGTDETG